MGALRMGWPETETGNGNGNGNGHADGAMDGRW